VGSTFSPQGSATFNGSYDQDFNRLVALGMAVGTGTLGLMDAFALAVVPPWLAFRLAPSWRLTVIPSAGLGAATYLIAILAALQLDQPFGPLLVAVLVLAWVLTSTGRRCAD
jgi:zinc/manganese transport system permease protein